MSQFTDRSLSLGNLLFGENGSLCQSTGRQQQTKQGLCFSLLAVVLVTFNLHSLMVGESYARATPIQTDRIEKLERELEVISKEADELKTKLIEKVKMAKATQSDLSSSDTLLSDLRNQLSETLKSKQALLSDLGSLNPNEPKYLYDLALNYKTQGSLTILEPATTAEETRERQSTSENQNRQCDVIMQLIAPIEKPGYLNAHLFLAKDALTRQVKSADEAAANLRLASTHLDHALVRDSNNTTALGFKVRIAKQFGQLEKAKAYLEKLFYLDPFVYPQLCEINNQQGVSAQNAVVLLSAEERIRDELSRMVGTSDRRTKYKTYLVDCLHRQEKLDAADKQVENDMKEFSTDNKVQRWGKRLLSIGQQLRYDAGIARLNGKLDAENTPELVGYLREGYRLDSNNVTLLRRIVSLARYDIPGIEKMSKDIYQPDRKAPASIENVLGTIALEKGEYAEARKRFENANVKSPDNAEYLNNLSYVYLTGPDPDPAEALKLVDKAIRSVQPSTAEAQYLSHFYDTKGRALLALGRIAEEDGDQKLASRRFSEAVAELQQALVEIDKGQPKNLPREGQDQRRLEISQAILECYEATGQTRQVKVWKGRVKQLDASK